VETTLSIQLAQTGHGSLHETAVLSGYLGAVFGAAMVIPQMIRVLRNRNLSGVSSLAWSLTGLSCFTWLLYGVRTHEIPQIAGNVVIVGGAVMIALLVPSHTTRRIRATRLAAAMLVVGLIAVVAWPTTLGLIAFGIGLCSSWPQVIASFMRDASMPSAVSRGTWVLRCGSQLAWLFYAVVIHDAVVTVSACTLLTTGILVLVFERRSTAPAEVPVPALALC
jgi:uncharacterized protein with PQ loop repeat